MSAIRRLRRKLQNAILLDHDAFLLHRYNRRIARRIRPDIDKILKSLKKQVKEARIWIHKIPGALVDINYYRFRKEDQVCTVCNIHIESWREFAYHHGKCVLGFIKNENSQS